MSNWVFSAWLLQHLDTGSLSFALVSVSLTDVASQIQENRADPSPMPVFVHQQEMLRVKGWLKNMPSLYPTGMSTKCCAGGMPLAKFGLGLLLNKYIT